jgi:DNA-directed RNA polymerase specialized sigma24 family protein
MVYSSEEALTDINDRLFDAKSELDDLYEERAELVRDAVDDGMSYREIGEALMISHTAVQKILDGVDPFRLHRGA